jgi:hypothetical protein
MDFFKQLDSAEGDITSKLRGGKAAEQAEFESLLKEVEAELEQASSRGPRNPTPAPMAEPVVMAVEAVVAEAVAEAVEPVEVAVDAPAEV